MSHVNWNKVMRIVNREKWCNAEKHMGNISDREMLKIARHHYSDGDIARAKGIMISLLDSDDPRTAQKAAAFIQQHDFDITKYENPVEQIQRNIHEFPQEITVKIVRPDGEKPKEVEQ